MNTDIRVPFINLRPTAQLIKNDVLSDWAEIIEKTEFVSGPSVTELEKKINQILAVNHTVACANGTDAILIALQVAGVKPDDKVALPNMTFWATYEAVAQLSAQPVLIDCDEQHLQLDFSEFKKAHQEHGFRYALIAHLMGWCHPELFAIRQYCQEHGIRLIEDGAQSYGVQVNNQSVYQGADISTLSFYPAKVLGGCLDGGAMLFREASDTQLARSLANHGRSAHYSYAHIGWNSRMSGVQAKYLLRSLEHIDDMLVQRRAVFARYQQLLAGVAGLHFYAPAAGITGNGYLCVLTADQFLGEEISQLLKKRGVGTGRVYPETMAAQKPAESAIRFGSLSRSTKFCEKVFNLPLFYGMELKDVDWVCGELLAALKKD